MKFTLSKSLVLACIVLFGNALLAKGLTLKSNDIKGQLSINQVFNGFGCKGKNISPQLTWSNIPKATKSFAITMHDVDAPKVGGWWHWVAFDIPQSTNAIASNASAFNKLPRGTIQSKTDFDGNVFGGACPPKGDKPHKYIITVYALNTNKLGLDKNAKPALVSSILKSHTIEKSSLIAYYKR